MKTIYILSILDELNKQLDIVRDWIIKHSDNPLFWLAFIVVGVLIFQFTFSALQKEK